MPAGMGEEERFAAAVENGTTPGSYGWGDDSADSVARELEIVAMLRSGGPALAPDSATRERAKRRLMAAFAQEFGHDADAAMEYAGGDGTAVTAPLQVLAPVALVTRAAPAHRAEPTPLRHGPRAGRHSAPEPDPVEEPQPVAEPDVAEPDAPDTDNVRPLRRRDALQRGGHRRGAAFFGAAAAATLVALAGTGTFASQDALPGDPMYGVKRVAESTSYALTFGEQAKARRHLEQAQRRLDEVEGLVARGRTPVAGTGTTASNPELVRSTMQEFDTDTNEGSRLLLSGSKPDTGQVDEVRTWATQQSERLTEIRSALPAPDRADESLALLDRVLGETAALQNAACAPGATGSGSASAGSGSAGSAAASGGSGTATAGDGACAPTASTTARGESHRATATPDDAKTSAGASATARHDDGDAGVDSDTSTDSSTDSRTTSTRTTTTGSSQTDGTDDPRRRNGGSGGGSSGSAGSGDNVSVPLGVPVTVPSVVPGVPGVSLDH
jgi:hypothetical protein